MIVVRDIFQVKFGKSKDATALWKQGLAILRKTGFASANPRILTDLAGGSYYTLVLETTFESLAQWEKASLAVRSDAEWKAWYPQLAQFIDSGRREILTVVE